jgi:tetratricopeptide (TPR) repeat protein
VQKQSRRWFTIIILGASSLVFIGLSILPLIGAITGQQTATPPTPSANAPDSPEILQKEADGYQIVLKRDPNNQSALQGFVETQLKLIRLGVRKPKDVVEPLEKLVKTNPNQPLYATLLAQAQQQAGDMNGATQTYRNLMTQQPTNIDGLQGYVALLIQQQKSAEALDLLKNTMATAKQMNQQQAGSVDFPALELLLGDVYLSQKRSGEAMDLYERLQKENSNDFRPLAAKGIVLRNQGKAQEAIALFKSAQALAPVQVKAKIQQLITTTESSPTPNPFSSSSPSSNSSPQTSP